MDISLLGRIGEKNRVQPGGDVTSGTGSEEGSVVDGRMRYPPLIQGYRHRETEDVVPEEYRRVAPAVRRILPGNPFRRRFRLFPQPGPQHDVECATRSAGARGTVFGTRSLFLAMSHPACVTILSADR